LLSVLAVQFVSIGLIGELIVHASGRADADRLIQDRLLPEDSGYVTAVVPEPAPRTSDSDR
jgi:hypothetical protein